MKRIKRKFGVTVSGKKGQYCIVLAENKNEAIEKAIKKMYGTRCFWFPDSGLDGYGQVFKGLQPTKFNSQPGNSAVTYQEKINVLPLAKKSKGFVNQEIEDKRLMEEIYEWEENL